MLAIIEINEFLDHFHIASTEEFYDLEYAIGPSMVENKLDEFDYQQRPLYEVAHHLKTVGRYEVSLDSASSQIIIKQDEESDDEDYGQGLF